MSNPTTRDEAFLDQRCENPYCDVNQIPEPLPTDTMFSTRPATIFPAAFCSRCLQPLTDAEPTVVIQPEPGCWEYRYHRRCLYPSDK